MIKFNLKRALYSLVAYGCISLALSSCVDNKYDLSGTLLDKDVSIGGSVTLPIGTTENITLESMLDGVDSDLLENIDGKYTITKSDAISESLKLDNSGIVIDGISQKDEIEIKFDLPTLPTLPGASNTPTLDLGDITADLGEITQKVEISTSVPKEICRIDSVDFKSNSVEATFEFDIKNLGNLDSDLSLSNYVIEFPKFFVFDKESGVVDNKLVINDKFIKSNGVISLKKELKIKKLKFTDSEYIDLITGSGDNKKLNINSIITLSGDLKLSTDGIDIKDIPSSALGTVTVNFGDMEVGKVYGIVDTEIDIESTKIDLSDLSGEFDGDISIVLSDPAIAIDIKNGASIPLQISKLELQPIKDGAILESISIDKPIDILPGTNEGSVTTKIYLSANDVTAPESGVTYVKLANLKNLLKEMPDYIMVNIAADVKEVATGENHILDLSKSEYNFDIKYSLDIPLTFEELNLSFSTKIEDLGGGLVDLFNYVSKLELIVDATNTLPIDLEISEILPLDKHGNKIISLPSFINNGENTIKADSESSIIKATIEDNNGDIDNLDALDIRIKANITQTDGGKDLKPSQYLKLKIKAAAPEGVKFNFDDTKEE